MTVDGAYTDFVRGMLMVCPAGGPDPHADVVCSQEGCAEGMRADVLNLAAVGRALLEAGWHDLPGAGWTCPEHCRMTWAGVANVAAFNLIVALALLEDEEGQDE